MQDNMTNTGAVIEKTDPHQFQKKIGSTVYTVSIHFSQTSNQTIEDKVLRLIESEVRKSA